MIKLVSIVKNSTIVLLNIIAGVLVVTSYVIPVNKYEWTQDPEMSKIINPDTVLVSIMMLVISIICASIAFAFKRKSKLQLVVYIVMLLLIVYKLIQVIPLYAG